MKNLSFHEKNGWVYENQGTHSEEKYAIFIENGPKMTEIHQFLHLVAEGSKIEGKLTQFQNDGSQSILILF